jgi:hypothetical protein
LIFVGVFVCLNVSFNGEHVDRVLDDLVVVRIQLFAGFLHEHQNWLAAVVRKVEKRSIHMQVALSLLGALIWL